MNKIFGSTKIFWEAENIFSRQIYRILAKIARAPHSIFMAHIWGKTGESKVILFDCQKESPGISHFPWISPFPWISRFRPPLGIL